MIDVCYSGTQKCLSCPPGLAPITFSDRAVERIRARERKAASWYLDLNLIDTYWTAGKRAYHHTAPISMNYALHEALRVALEEGLEARFERHRANSRALVAGLEALGFEMFVPQESERLPMLHTVTLPAGVADVAVRRRLLEEYGIEIGAGLGEFAGKIWRIGLMGESSRRENVIFFLSALEALLLDTGAVDGMGAGVEAAARQYSKAGTGA
jgi:alanine-glyoxylate transaminase/serine-glyoxylate transaminase/serine-pyruvate transaminase